MTLRLIRAELQANPIFWITMISFFLAIYIVFLGWGLDELNNSLPAIRVVMLTISAFVFLQRVLRISKEKIDRLMMQLPLTLSKVGLVRAIVPNIIWFVMVIFLFTGISVLKPAVFSMEIVWNFTTITGFVLSANALPLIQRDLSNIFSEQWQKHLLTGLYTGFVVLGYAIFIMLILETSQHSFFFYLNSAQQLFRPLIFSLIGSVGMLLIGLTLFFSSAFIFKLRKTYIE